MIVKHLTELRASDYALRHVIAHMQYWRDGSSWIIPSPGRKNTAVMVLLGVNAWYMDLNTGLELAHAGPNSIVFIPQGSSYEFRVRISDPRAKGVEGISSVNYYLDGVKNDEENEHRTANVIFLGFEMTDENSEPMTVGSRINIYSLKGREEIVSRCERIARSSGKGFVPPALLSARIYELLTVLSEMAFSEKPHSKAYRRIEPALRYLDTHKVGSVTVNELAAICGLSTSGFRRIFHNELGRSPRDYITDQVLSRAITLLESGDLSIEEVAYECCFEDQFYFSRFFSKNTGMPPSRWKEQNRREQEFNTVTSIPYE